MRKIKVLAIAPYEGMAEIITALSAAREDIDITVRTGNLHTGLRIAHELSYKDYDVIISRGGTAELLQRELEIPVINIPLSVYDMLRSIKMAESYAGKFAIAGFQSITGCARILCDLLNLNIKIFTFETSEQVEPILCSLKEQEYNLVVCDMIGSITAHSLGLNAILVPSGTESISDSLDEAVKLIHTSRHIIKQNDIFQKALTYDNESVVIYDQDGHLWYSTLTKNELYNPILNMAQTFLPAFIKTDGQVFERQYDNYIVTIINQHIYYEDKKYIVLRMKKNETLFKDDNNSISIYNKIEDKFHDLSIYYSSTNSFGNIENIINDYSKTAFPVLITGETGAGKDQAASLIYENGPYQSSPFYIIDCAFLNERKWKKIIDSEKSPFNNIKTTIYIKNLNRLTNEQFSDFQLFIDQTDLIKRNRLIFSLINNTADFSIFYNYLANHLSCLLLPLPALRDRADDIPSISALYINQLNVLTGKQIVGFEPDAIQLVKDYSWPNNLDQLRRIIKELVTITKNSYITAESVRQLLKAETMNEKILPVGNLFANIDPNQTLEEITYHIILNVMKEEGMNKENTSQRLGISRSTLWRVLKSHDPV